MKLKYIGYFEVGSTRYSGCLPCGGRRAISAQGLQIRNPYIVIYKGKEYKFVPDQILDVPDALGQILLTKNSIYQGMQLNAFENQEEAPLIEQKVPDDYPTLPPKKEIDEEALKESLKPKDPEPDPVPPKEPDVPSGTPIRVAVWKAYGDMLDEVTIPASTNDTFQGIMDKYNALKNSKYKIKFIMIQGSESNVKPEENLLDEDITDGVDIMVTANDGASDGDNGDSGDGGGVTPEPPQMVTVTLVNLDENLFEISRVTETVPVDSQLSLLFPDGYDRSNFLTMYLPDGLRNVEPYSHMNWDLIEQIRNSDNLVDVDIERYTNDSLLITEAKPDMDGKVIYQRLIPEHEKKYAEFSNQRPYGYNVVYKYNKAAVYFNERKHYYMANDDDTKFSAASNLLFSANPQFKEARVRASANNQSISILIDTKIPLLPYIQVMTTLAEVRRKNPNLIIETVVPDDQPLFGSWIAELKNPDTTTIKRK